MYLRRTWWLFSINNRFVRDRAIHRIHRTQTNWWSSVQWTFLSSSFCTDLIKSFGSVSRRLAKYKTALFFITFSLKKWNIRNYHMRFTRYFYNFFFIKKVSKIAYRVCVLPFSGRIAMRQLSLAISLLFHPMALHANTQFWFNYYHRRSSSRKF